MFLFCYLSFLGLTSCAPLFLSLLFTENTKVLKCIKRRIQSLYNGCRKLGGSGEMRDEEVVEEIVNSEVRSDTLTLLICLLPVDLA